MLPQHFDCRRTIGDRLYFVPISATVREEPDAGSFHLQRSESELFCQRKPPAAARRKSEPGRSPTKPVQVNTYTRSSPGEATGSLAPSPDLCHHCATFVPIRHSPSGSNASGSPVGCSQDPQRRTALPDSPSAVNPGTPTIRSTSPSHPRRQLQ